MPAKVPQLGDADQLNANLAKFDHLVVLMMENRSFDHLLGFLYEQESPNLFIPSDDPIFRGVSGRSDLGNYDSQSPPLWHPVVRAPYATLTDMTRPFPDPGEEFYPHMNHQIYGQDNVPSELYRLPGSAPMSGFVTDYLRVYHEKGRHFRAGVSDEQLAREIMSCFPPQATPVLSGLARSFAVSDSWFAPVPSQTYTNRSFLHAADSSGFVHNANYAKWSQNRARTIFEHLADKFPGEKGFRIYWDKADKFPITRLINRPLYDSCFDDSFVDMEQFKQDCASGTLPAYSFIQPRILIHNNDMHPAFFPSQNADSSILAGEDLIAQVYDALRTGPRWERTLFVILFDEHGGTYDHVPPPTGAAPPYAELPYPLEQGFRFNRFGVRVPAIFVSPFIEPGTVIRASGPTPFDHTSVIKTLCLRFGLPSLTDRDRAAPDFTSVLTRPLTAPRKETPTFLPRPHIPPTLQEARLAPLSGIQNAMFGLLSKHKGMAPRNFQNLGEALDHFF